MVAGRNSGVEVGCGNRRGWDDEDVIGFWMCREGGDLEMGLG